MALAPGTHVGLQGFYLGESEALAGSVGLLVAQQLWAPALISNKTIATPGQGLL